MQNDLLTSWRKKSSRKRVSASSLFFCSIVQLLFHWFIWLLIYFFSLSRVLFCLGWFFFLFYFVTKILTFWVIQSAIHWQTRIISWTHVLETHFFCCSWCTPPFHSPHFILWDYIWFNTKFILFFIIFLYKNKKCILA